MGSAPRFLGVAGEERIPMAHQHAIIGFGGMGTWHWQNVTERVDGLDVKGIHSQHPGNGYSLTLSSG